MRLNHDVLVVFSGRMFAGKDYVAAQAGLPTKGFSDPMYQLTEYFFGTTDKTAPGIRQFLQRLGQWGWGCLNEDCPATPERASLTHAIRTHGKEMTKDYAWVDWSEYGRRQDFWVNICLTCLGLVGTRFTPDEPGSLFPCRQPKAVAITNARFMHELKPCRSAGFNHYHIRCTEETRRERMEMRGYKFNENADNDVSEQLAKQFDSDLPDNTVVWNDTRPAPTGRSYLTVDRFVGLINPQATPRSRGPVRVAMPC